MFANNRSVPDNGSGLGDARQDTDSCTLPNSDEVTFSCVKCAFRPDSLEALRRHVTVDHLKWIPYECLYCDLFKATDEELTVHILDAHPFKAVKLVVEKNEPMRLQLEHLIEQSTHSRQEFSKRRNHLAHPTVTTVYLGNESGMAVGSHNVVAPWSLLLPKPEIIDIGGEGDDTVAHSSPLSIGSQSTFDSSRETNGGCKDESRTMDKDAAAPTTAIACQSATTPNCFPINRVSTSCQMCGAGSIGHKHRKEHVYAKHVLEVALSCKYCGKYGYGKPNISHLRAHIRKRHGEKDLEAGIDDRRDQLQPLVEVLLMRCFGAKAKTKTKTTMSAILPPLTKNQSAKLASLVQTNKPNHCFVCETGFVGPAQGHVTDKHRKRTAACKYCPYRYRYKQDMKEHLQGKHSMESELEGLQHALKQIEQRNDYWLMHCFNITAADISDGSPIAQS